MKAVSPYLNFPGNTEEAFGFYRSVFGGEFLVVVRYGDFPDNSMGVKEHQLDKVAHIALPLTGGSILMGTDTFEGRQALNQGNNFYVHLETESREEAEKLFNRLADGGRVEMPLQKTEWAETYGSCIDKFNVQWMVMYTGDVKFSR